VSIRRDARRPPIQRRTIRRRQFERFKAGGIDGATGSRQPFAMRLEATLSSIDLAFPWLFETSDPRVRGVKDDLVQGPRAGLVAKAATPPKACLHGPCPVPLDGAKGAIR